MTVKRSAIWPPSCRHLAALWPGTGSSGTDEQRFAGGFDDLGGDGLEVVDLSDALDLGEQSVDEAEVAAGDAGEVAIATVWVESSPGAGPDAVASPSACQRRVSTTGLSGRYSWAKPMRLYSCG